MTNTLLPTTMVGSYPRPSWFTHQLEGRDILEAFKVIFHKEAFEDAVKCVIDDQERAGLDILADGQMWFDDYSMGIIIAVRLAWVSIIVRDVPRGRCRPP